MNFKLLVLAFIITFSSSANAEENTVFEGDQRLACEALLCLTVGWGESTCRPAIKKFFSIWSWKPSRLFSKRMGFLGLCPSGMSSNEQQLIANYSGRCQGQRFTRYVSAYRSYASVESENGGVMRSACHWNDQTGLWVNSQAIDACQSSDPYAERLSMASEDCAAFRATFPNTID